MNIAAATCLGTGDRAELHILVKHAEAARHSLAISHLAVTREREVVVVDVEDRPGVLADLTRRIARAGVDLDLVYVATRNRVVFGAPDLAALRAALEARPDAPRGPATSRAASAVSQRDRDRLRRHRAPRGRRDDDAQVDGQAVGAQQRAAPGGVELDREGRRAGALGALASATRCGPALRGRSGRP